MFSCSVEFNFHLTSVYLSLLWDSRCLATWTVLIWTFQGENGKKDDVTKLRRLCYWACCSLLDPSLLVDIFCPSQISWPLCWMTDQVITPLWGLFTLDCMTAAELSVASLLSPFQFHLLRIAWASCLLLFLHQRWNTGGIWMSQCVFVCLCRLSGVDSTG